MAALGGFLTLAVCVLLGDPTEAKNSAPCQPSRWNNGHNTFVKRHIRDGTPASLDQNEWMAYIKNNGGCDRPTQSFLKAKDKALVNDVCSPKGGKRFKENLCISQQAFTFVTVRSEPGTCGIRSVREESKHLILACEVLENQCLPVHFEGNPQDLKPNRTSTPCQESRNNGVPPNFKLSWLLLLSVLLLIIYAF